MLNRLKNTSHDFFLYKTAVLERCSILVLKEQFKAQVLKLYSHCSLLACVIS